MRGPLEWRTKKEAEKQKSARRGSLSAAFTAPITRRFSEHEFFSARTATVQFIHPEDSLAARGEREEEVLCGKRSYLSMLFCSSTFIGLFPVD